MIKYNNIIIENPNMLLFLIPLMIFLIFLFNKKFVKQSEYVKKRTFFRIIIFLFKLIIFSLLTLAVASPVIERYEKSTDVPTVDILVDYSDSMKVFDLNDIEELKYELEKEGILVTLDRIETTEHSPLGDYLLRKLQPDSNTLFVSDGRVNQGTSLEDVAFFGANMNSRIYGIELDEENKDVAVTIEGPSKVITGVENIFQINLKKVATSSDVELKITIDDKIVFEQSTDKEHIEIRQSFNKGYHKIQAEIFEEDLFPQNNKFYKVVNVVEKPKILFISDDNSPLGDILRALYDVDVEQQLPEALSEYYAVILNNVPGEDFTVADIDLLGEFVANGNGLLVFGGKDSFDWGDYNKSVIMQLLPVGIGTPKKREDIVSIVVALDTGVSGALHIVEDDETTPTFIEIEKALAIDILDAIANTNNVAVIESNANPSIISGLSELGPKKTDLKEKIRDIKIHDTTRIFDTPLIALDMLKFMRGSKYLVLLTDGKVGVTSFYATAMKKNLAKLVQEGVKTIIVGVGNTPNVEFLTEMAQSGNGRYIQADDRNQLSIFFGDPDGRQRSQSPSLFIYDNNHFITDQLESLGKVYGFNSVYPKTSATLLVTTQDGDPILVVWRYGLGRVATVATDDGSYWASDLLKPDNSAFIIRTINWAIENPERKLDPLIEVPDMVVNETATVTVYSTMYPEEEGLSFFEERDNVYKAYYLPFVTGFSEIMDREAAVNYKKEYLELGVDTKLDKILAISGGEILKNVEEISEKLKSMAKAESVQRISISWLFLLGSLVVYILELVFRRIFEIRFAKDYK
ncbi:VWA domain-containing protein [Candidatus Woesearchaeota archaeon]|nr:VWA domain-containing protein [Candidatus Woesearchaeota archaeon]